MSGEFRFEKSKFVFTPDGFSAGLGPAQTRPSVDVVSMIFVWKTPPPTTLRPVSSMSKPPAVFHTVGAKAPNWMLALTPASSGAITLPPLAQVMPSDDVA